MRRLEILGALLCGLSLSGCAVGSTASTDSTTSYIDTKYTTSSTTDLSNSTPSTWKALNTHDPFLFKDDDGTYYSFSTDASIGNTWSGGGIQIRKSSDLVNWTCLSTGAIPNGYWGRDFCDWLGYTVSSETANGCYASSASVWAPCVIKFNGKYYMYYGMNADITSGVAKGYAHAYIGLAIADKVTGPYKHYAKIVRSTTLSGDSSTTTNDTTLCTNTGYGCIDPNITWDDNGDMWMNYGSWRGGIAVMRLNNKTGLPLAGDTDKTKSYGTHIAGGNGASTEGSCILQHGSYYYVFYSQGNLNADYSVRVGRRLVSDGIDGAYLDSDGFDLSTVVFTSGSTRNNHLRGNKILGSFQFGTEFGWRAPGGQSILVDDDGTMLMAVHSRTNFFAGYYFYLQIRQLYFTDDGWPLLNPNEYNGEELVPIDSTDLVGTWDAVMTERTNTLGSWSSYEGTAYSNINVTDAVETDSKTLTFASDGTISGSNYSGTWSISDDYKITIALSDASMTAIGTFTGVVSEATDWARASTAATRDTFTFTAFSADTGEYFFGNLHNF